jgi:hypothetical protein
MSDRQIGAFSHIAKTGGLQVARVLQQYHGVRHMAVEPRSGHLYSADDLAWDVRVHRHVVSITGHSLRPFIDYGPLGQRLTWYTVLRQPVARLLSHFTHEVAHRDQPNDLYRWMQDTPRSNFQVRMLAGEEDLSAAIEVLNSMAVVGLLEHLPASLVMVREALGWPGLEVVFPGKVNASSSHLREQTRLAAEQHMDDILAANELDLKLYEYASGILWPRQIDAVGGEERIRTTLDAEAGRATTTSRALTKCHRASYLGYRRLIQRPLGKLRRNPHHRWTQ